MRAISPSALLLLLALGNPLCAQPARDIRQVTVPEAELHSGPGVSREFYVTNRLRQGSALEVLAELPGGWLAVRPPQGSFSYINMRFVRQVSPNMPNYAVSMVGSDVPVYIGSEVLNRRPTIVGVKLEPGTQVIGRGKPIRDEDGTWLPIESPPREQRYIQASLLNKAPADTLLSRTAAPATLVSRPTRSLQASTAPSATPPVTPESMYERARQADSAGQISEAIRLYARAGADSARSNPQLSAWALQRATYLQSGYQNYSTGVTPAVSRGAPRVETQASARVPATLSPPTVPVSTQREASSFTPAPAAAGPRSANSQWTGVRGILRARNRFDLRASVYRLEHPQTLQPLGYVTPAPGVNLEAYVNRAVSVWGYTCYQGSLRSNLMTVQQVQPE